jgi:hypothetical protein
MEKFSKTKEKIISPEEFFEKYVEVYKVTKDNFVKLVKQISKTEHSDEKILNAKGINSELNGKVIILLRKDIYPEEYMPYLETHEKWEAYIARKKGFNLWDRSIREYKNDKNIQNYSEEDKKRFLKDIDTYNYDFRHEYAIYKEYEQAFKDGKLDEYHDWFIKLREKEKLETKSEDNFKLIENDTKIRKSVYEKIINNSPHLFTKN